MYRKTQFFLYFSIMFWVFFFSPLLNFISVLVSTKRIVLDRDPRRFVSRVDCYMAATKNIALNMIIQQVFFSRLLFVDRLFRRLRVVVLFVDFITFYLVLVLLESRRSCFFLFFSNPHDGYYLFFHYFSPQYN